MVLYLRMMEWVLFPSTLAAELDNRLPTATATHASADCAELGRIHVALPA